MIDSNDSKPTDDGMVERIEDNKSTIGLDDCESSITSQQSAGEDENWRKVLSLCQQINPIPFGLEFPSKSYNRLAPIECGSYSLVSRGYDKRINKEVVFKIINVVSYKMTKKLNGIPFDGKELLSDVINEIMVTKSLSNLHITTVNREGHEFMTHSFPRMISARLVQGVIPNYLLLKATNDSMDKLEKLELNRETPGTPREYLVLTLKNCGQPLWKMIKMKKIDANQLISICYQLTLALAVSEHIYEFEHRDLHIANILLNKTKKKTIKYVIKTQCYKVQSFGIKACIIDTTFSRIKIGDKVFFTSLSNRLNQKLKVKNPDLQDWVYIQMTKEARDDWEKWNPETNLFWLRYFYKTVLMSTVVNECKDSKPKNILQDLLKNVINFKTLKDFIKTLDNIH